MYFYNVLPQTLTSPEKAELASLVLKYLFDCSIGFFNRSGIWPPIFREGNALDSVEDVSRFVKFDDVIASGHAVNTHSNIILGRIQL